jgi:hypothetical protein
MMSVAENAIEKSQILLGKRIVLLGWQNDVKSAVFFGMHTFEIKHRSANQSSGQRLILSKNDGIVFDLPLIPAQFDNSLLQNELRLQEYRIYFLRRGDKSNRFQFHGSLVIVSWLRVTDALRELLVHVPYYDRPRN